MVISLPLAILSAGHSFPFKKVFEAAVLVPGLGLAQQLWHVGEADAACRQRLLEDACYRLDQHGVQTLLAGAQASAAGFSLWERALQQRLTGLGLLAATNGPAVDAPRR